MTPLIGVSFALVPELTLLAAVVGVATVLLMRKHYLRSSLGICTGFALMLALSLAFQVDVDLVAGLTVLAVLVILRSLIVRRRISADVREIIDELDPDLPPGMSESD